jgi:hypothetical protein
MATTYYERYMRAFAATMQVQERWWGKHTELVSGGPLQCPMLRTACGYAKEFTIPPSWPFTCWSLDMIGPFTMAPGGFTHALVAIDKFTKWIEYNR